MALRVRAAKSGTRVSLLQVIVIAIGVVQAAVLHDGQQGASLYP